MSKSLAVILADPNGFQPPLVAAALAELRKLPMQDAIHIAKRSWGIVADGLDQSQATVLREALQAKGVASVVLPSDSVAEPRTANSIKQAIPEKDGLGIVIKPPGR